MHKIKIDMEQMRLRFRTKGAWGGKRKGAGRPRLTEAQRRARRSLVPRVTRPELPSDQAVHVTLRAVDSAPSFRDRERFCRMREAINFAKDWNGMRIVHFAVLKNHVHLIVEAKGKTGLTAGMQGLAIRLARAINGKARRGRVFRDRYHAHVLDSPWEAHAAVQYVLLNARKHACEKGIVPRHAIDPCSSGFWFTGWTVRPNVHAPWWTGPPPIVLPISRSLQVHGLDPKAVPGVRRRRLTKGQRGWLSRR